MIIKTLYITFLYNIIQFFSLLNKNMNLIWKIYKFVLSNNYIYFYITYLYTYSWFSFLMINTQNESINLRLHHFLFSKTHCECNTIIAPNNNRPPSERMLNAYDWPKAGVCLSADRGTDRWADGLVVLFSSLIYQTQDLQKKHL